MIVYKMATPTTCHEWNQVHVPTRTTRTARRNSRRSERARCIAAEAEDEGHISARRGTPELPKDKRNLGPMTDVEKMDILKIRSHDVGWLQHILTSATVDDILLQPENKHISYEVAKHEAATVGRDADVRERLDKPRSSSSDASAAAVTPSPSGSVGTLVPPRRKSESTLRRRTSRRKRISSSCKICCRHAIAFTKDTPDNSWRLSSYGMRFSRAWNPHGFKDSATELVQIAWKRAILLKHEESFFFLAVFTCDRLQKRHREIGANLHCAVPKCNHNHSVVAVSLASVIMICATDGM